MPEIVRCRVGHGRVVRRDLEDGGRDVVVLEDLPERPSPDQVPDLAARTGRTRSPILTWWSRRSTGPRKHRPVGLRVAVHEIEDAVPARVRPGDEVRPGDRALGRDARPERPEAALADQARESGQLPLRQPAPDEAVVQPSNPRTMTLWASPLGPRSGAREGRGTGRHQRGGRRGLPDKVPPGDPVHVFPPPLFFFETISCSGPLPTSGRPSICPGHREPEKRQHGGGDVDDGRRPGRDLAVEEEDPRHVAGVDAVVAAPGLDVVFEHRAVHLAGDGIPGGPVALVVADDQVGGVVLIWSGVDPVPVDAPR